MLAQGGAGAVAPSAASSCELTGCARGDALGIGIAARRRRHGFALTALLLGQRALAVAAAPPAPASAESSQSPLPAAAAPAAGPSGRRVDLPGEAFAGSGYPFRPSSQPRASVASSGSGRSSDESWVFPVEDEETEALAAEGLRQEIDRDADSSTSGRRLTAVGTGYSFSNPLIPNGGIAGGTDKGYLPTEEQVLPNETNVNVHAGVVYESFVIHANSGLGNDRTRVLVKLVPYDMASTMQSCAEITSYTEEPPFNGEPGVNGGGLPPMETTRNEFKEVRFPLAGEFRLCYSRDSTKWEELEPMITVYGAEFSNNKIWCSLKTMQREVCQTAPTTDGCECLGKIEGYKRSNETEKLIGLGTVNPPYPSWRLTLIETGGLGCGEAPNVGPFGYQVSEVTQALGYEVHNFGNRDPATFLNVWAVCYCVGYDADRGLGTNLDISPCHSSAVEDFAQSVGILVNINTETYAGTDIITVYPTIRSNLVIQCGSNGQDASLGGCTDTTEPRYKIIFQAMENDLAYYEPEAGCRFYEQAEITREATKVFGAHLAPDNCEAASVCHDIPDVLSARTPTFYHVQIGASYWNNVMVAMKYDVCYCDANCFNAMSWFKAGEINVQPIRMYFSEEPPTLPAFVVVNKLYYLTIEEDRDPDYPGVINGGWQTSGSFNREMKIVSDNGGYVDSAACATLEQPDAVAGHRLMSGNTDYTDPSETLLTVCTSGQCPTGQLYGRVEGAGGDSAPNIKLREPGWYAICYCDTNCNEVLNWVVAGRQIISGPNPDQSWTQYTGITFSLRLEGWGLHTTNRILIIDPGKELADCGREVQDDSVFGPPITDAADLRSYATGDGIVMTSFSYDPSGRGTEISFNSPHGLIDGDRIRLEQVNVEGSLRQSEMYNTDHEVTVSCDSVETGCHKINVDVNFDRAEFPTIRLDSARWTRSSEQMFHKMQISDPSPEGRGYIVCWSQVNEEPEFFGQVGRIRVVDPVVMPIARLGLTTVEPHSANGLGAPVVLQIVTGPISHYENAVGQLHVKIAINKAQINGEGDYYPIFELKDNLYQPVVANDYNDFNSWETATQAVCGRLLTELWTDAPDGFPMPDGCWYDEDDTNADRILPQIHILFSPRNHLMKETTYMFVFHAETMINAGAPPDSNTIKFDWPDAPVFVYSMDDVISNPYRVIEIGRTILQPENRQPPRDTTTRFLVLSEPTGDGPWFHPDDGFKILPDGIDTTSGSTELTGYCKKYDPLNPRSTPTAQYECLKCRTESDCGNDNPELTFCTSPISDACGMTVELFRFQLRGEIGHSIKGEHLLRIFLHPLLQWKIGRCTGKVAYIDGGCTTSGGSPCTEDPECVTESVIGGELQGNWDYPTQILRIKFPLQMRDTSNEEGLHTYFVKHLAIPMGGFFPLAMGAELADVDNQRPYYWSHNQIATDGNRLYVKPKILAASLVTYTGSDGFPIGNDFPFRGEEGNILYLRMVIGANLYAAAGNQIKFTFRLPNGYFCAADSNVGAENVPQLEFLQDRFPSTQGQFGGNYAYETTWVNIEQPEEGRRACDLEFVQYNMYYAYAVVFTEVKVDNPDFPMTAIDEENYWDVTLYNTAYFTPGCDPCAGDFTRTETFILRGDSTPYYGGSVSVLGMLSNMVISPTNFGVSQYNTMMVFFQTEQMVGTLDQVESQLWVDAPSGFDFEEFCMAGHLEDSYYIPEASPRTFKMPFGQVVTCRGEPFPTAELFRNRAKLDTIARMLPGTLYGFELRVMNSELFVRTQTNSWFMWTYTKNGVPVDGSYSTAKFNRQDPQVDDSSFGIYQNNIPQGNFGISIANLLPVVNGPSEITVLPIIVSVVTQRSMRVIAPEGFIWDFEQSEFRYKAPGYGVPEQIVLQGVEADMPISGVPSRPIAEPRNRLAIDYMQASWTPGVVYGFLCKIQVPPLGPTASGNIFAIEFGYNELYHAERMEGGTVAAPLPQRIINGEVSYTSNIKAVNDNDLMFRMRTVSHIPRGGGLVITGPRNFIFDEHCQPKPDTGFPELPPDVTCMATIRANGEPEVTIVAGPLGIPPADYKFYFQVTNPISRVVENTGTWTVYSYSLYSEQIILDYNTSMAGFPVSERMTGAEFIMPPKKVCNFYTASQREDNPSLPPGDCQPIDWSFYAPYGGRNDRPGQRSMLILQFQLSYAATDQGVMELHAPRGYTFNSECTAEVNPCRIFDATGDPDCALPPYGWTGPEGLLYALWPPEAEMLGCRGEFNVARVTLDPGLTFFAKYLIRISVLENPPVTPDWNYFRLEYNGESSEIFEGPEIWAFKNASIIPTTTAASVSGRWTPNVVTIQLKPVNDLPSGGHLMIVAPAAFVIPTVCNINISLHFSMPTEQHEGMDLIRYERYTVFNQADGHYFCEGDYSPSFRGRLKFPAMDNNGIPDGRYLNASFVYILHLEVMNPLTTTPEAKEWFFQSFGTWDKSEPIDEVSIPGFSINYILQRFSWLTPTSVNAGVRQILDLNLSFPETVDIGNTIQVRAPESFIFSTKEDSRCPEYVNLDGNLRRTVPVCGTRTMQFFLEQESVPGSTPLRFRVEVRNPVETPEDNMWQVREIGPGDVILSSRKEAGFRIVPGMMALTVEETFASGPFAIPCRVEVIWLTYKPCQAVGSTTSIVVSFMPTLPADLVSIGGNVAGEIFDFEEATLGVDDIGAPIPVYSRSAEMIVADMPAMPETPVSIRVDGIINPPVSGQAMWTITTYVQAPERELRRNELSEYGTFYILDYIRTVYEEVVPAYYDYFNAEITFEVRLDFTVELHDVFRVTRPTGFRFLEGTLRTYYGFQVSEDGADTSRFFNQSLSMDPEDYYMVLAAPIGVNERVRWTFNLDLPDIPYPDKFWFFRFYRLLPIRDFDGEILDDSHVPYPWIPRVFNDLQYLGTNDGNFGGFLLVGDVPFTVNPSLQTPGADIALTLTFGLPAPVEAQVEVRLELTAPSGFEFADNCFYGSPIIFSRCQGYRNLATLTTVARTVAGAEISVAIKTKNPASTPGDNTWTLRVFKDDRNEVENMATRLGYPIEPMKASYKGNNQFGEVGTTSFFTFTPMQKHPDPAEGRESPVLYIVVTPPPNQGNGGYRLNCQGVEPMSFGPYESCTSQGLNMPLTLKFSNATLMAEESYTFGVGVSNPSVQPGEADNIWGVLLQDQFGVTFDGNQQITGILLSSRPFRMGYLGWTTAQPRTLAIIMMQFRVLYRVNPGMMKTVEIIAPEGIMYSEDANSVQIVPAPLPLLEASPTRVAGDILYLNIDYNYPVAQGMYNIRFEVSNPTQYARDNTWTIIVMRDIETEFSHTMAGYIEGQESPIYVQPTYEGTGAARRKATVSCWELLTLVSAFLGLSRAANAATL